MIRFRTHAKGAQQAASRTGKMGVCGCVGRTYVRGRYTALIYMIHDARNSRIALSYVPHLVPRPHGIYSACAYYICI